MYRRVSFEMKQPHVRYKFLLCRSWYRFNFFFLIYFSHKKIFSSFKLCGKAFILKIRFVLFHTPLPVKKFSRVFYPIILLNEF